MSVAHILNHGAAETRHGDTVYVISSKWWRQWAKQVRYDESKVLVDNDEVCIIVVMWEDMPKLASSGCLQLVQWVGLVLSAVIAIFYSCCRAHRQLRHHSQVLSCGVCIIWRAHDARVKRVSIGSAGGHKCTFQEHLYMHGTNFLRFEALVLPVCVCMCMQLSHVHSQVRALMLAWG